MELSIIIVNFNTTKLTLGCLSSIKKHPPKVPFEVIVIDNGSEEKLSIGDKKIIVIRNVENLGFAKANNQGIKRAKGKYILLLNSDTVVKEGAIDKLLLFAANHPDAGAVVPKLLNPDGSTQASAFRFPTLVRTVKQYWFGQKGILDKFVPSKSTVEEAVMAAYLITPICLKKVGRLDNGYHFYFEDFDYARRIKNAGLKIYYVPEAEVIHYHGSSGKKLADQLNQWRRLVPGSIRYHGLIVHYLIFFVMWSSQKWKKLVSQN